MPIAVLALAIAAFAIGTTEFVIVGLIPEIAGELDVSVPSAGLLVSMYALAITLGAPTITALTQRLPRKALALGLMTLFTAGNLAAALAPSFGTLLAGRMVTGVAHGVFFSIGAAIATSLVDRSRASRAVSLMFAGLTVAMVVGVPLGSFIGQTFGWRAPFLLVGALGVLSFASLALFLPGNLRIGEALPLKRQFALVATPRLLSLYLITVFGFGGSFVVFTYLTPLLTDVTGIAPASVSLALMLFGLATVVGNLAGGAASDRLGATTALGIVLIGLVASLAMLLVTQGSVWAISVNLAVWGGFAFAISPIVQSAVVETAEAGSPGAGAVASGFNIAAFNLGISGASAVGGAIVAGPGVGMTPVVAALSGMIALGLVSLTAAKAQENRA
ncbi:MFS transporter [Stappia taiwanensis]|uniref:MFS transporter n=1 Tax=Stappia taiwanensis TaxID=992267 RepID=A0A838XX11_9HYPH|nr:MFS transporter [Stappia taiwanensis]MBA4613591.1 MFS transporter [Stappia taiwanensis]GGE98948.1 MFS transporter [Stappia taiwanensis]